MILQRRASLESTGSPCAPSSLGCLGGSPSWREAKGGTTIVHASQLRTVSPLSKYRSVAPVEGIAAVPTVEEVVSASSFDVIGAPEAKERVGPTIAEESVRALRPEHDLDRFHEVIAIPAQLTGREVDRHRPSKTREEKFISARSSVEDIIAGVVAHEDGISATSSTDDILAGLVTETVAASATMNHVVSSLSVGEIGAPISVEEIVACAGQIQSPPDHLEACPRRPARRVCPCLDLHRQDRLRQAH